MRHPTWVKANTSPGVLTPIASDPPIRPPGVNRRGGASTAGGGGVLAMRPWSAGSIIGGYGPRLGRRYGTGHAIGRMQTDMKHHHDLGTMTPHGLCSPVGGPGLDTAGRTACSISVHLGSLSSHTWAFSPSENGMIARRRRTGAFTKGLGHAPSDGRRRRGGAHRVPPPIELDTNISFAHRK